MLTLSWPNGWIKWADIFRKPMGTLGVTKTKKTIKKCLKKSFLFLPKINFFNKIIFKIRFLKNSPANAGHSR